MKKASLPINLLTAGLFLLASPSWGAAAADKVSPVEDRSDRSPPAASIIFMVPDGLGLAAVTAARLARYGPQGGRLAFERLPVIGYQSTHSASSLITDSAAAASAWACGEKFHNGEICFHREGAARKPSVLELAKAGGKATGLVATSSVTHATPAAFGAHVASRECETEIAHQYVTGAEVDVLLGGGLDHFRPSDPDPCGNDTDVIAAAEARGYTVVFTGEQLEAADSGRLLGLFAPEGLPPEYQRPAGTTAPRLPEMTKAALKTLEQDRDGFFLVVEGSQIDWAGHDHNLTYQVGETLAFAEAVQVVLDWLGDHPRRAESTLLIVASDHETGGFAVNGPKGHQSAPGKRIEPGWTTRRHTGSDTLVWSRGPGSEALGRALDNTDLYDVMVGVLQRQFPARPTDDGRAPVQKE